MNRLEEINNKTAEYEMADILKKAELFQNDVSEDEFKMYARDFVWPLDKLFKEIKNLQDQGNKKEIYFINIYFLHSTFQKGSLELLVEAYDEQFLFDKEPVCIQYSPQCMAEAAQNDWLQYETYMKKSVIQIRYHELQPYFLKLAQMYIPLIREIFRAYIPIIVNLASYREIQKNEDIKIGYGEYGCTGITLFEGQSNKKRNDKDEILLN